MKIFILTFLFLIQSPFSIASDEDLQTCMFGSANYFEGGYLTREECKDHFLKTLFDRKYLRESIPELYPKEKIAYGCREMEEGLELSWGPYGDEYRVLPKVRCPILRSANFLDIDFPTDPDPYDPSRDRDAGFCFLHHIMGRVEIDGGYLTRQQCIDTIYNNIQKQKFFGLRKLIKKSCMREKNNIKFLWRAFFGGMEKIPVMTIKCSLWNDWLKKTETESVGDGGQN